MTRPAKWAKGSKVEQPVSKVARRLLSHRFNILREHFPKAAKKAQEDIEYVHQLRVCTRRSMAALQTFEGFVPRRRARQLMKMLRRVRKAAGESRDLDVLQQRLCDRDSNHITDVEIVLAGLAARRLQAQQPLAKIYKRWKKKKYGKQVDGLLIRVYWRGQGKEPSFGAVAPAALRPIVADFFQAADGDLSDIASLHRLRICAKRLRYTMELMARAFAPSFLNELYPNFTLVQQRLGAINDHATAKAFFESWLLNTSDARESAELARLVVSEQQQIDETRDTFRQWWTPMCAQQLRRQFNQYLSESPHAVKSDDRSDPSCAASF